MDIEVKERAGLMSFARKGSALHASQALPFVAIPISSLRKKIEDEATWTQFMKLQDELFEFVDDPSYVPSEVDL